jgi:putative serine protease PepD
MTEDSKDRPEEPRAVAGGPAAPGGGSPADASGARPTEHLAPVTPAEPQTASWAPQPGPAQAPQTASWAPQPGPFHAPQPAYPYVPSQGPQPGPATAQHAAFPPPDAGHHHTAAIPPYPAGAPGEPYPLQGSGRPADGYQPAGPGPVPAAGYPAGPPRRGRAGLAAAAVVLVLLGGGVGGAVGAWIEHSTAGSPVTNALDVPPPKVNPAGAAAPAGTVAAVAQKVLPTVVMIKVSGARTEGEGSGVVLSSDGLILTNNHVASGAGPNAKMEVQFSDGTTATATVVGVDPISDLAVIKATGKSGLTPIELGTSAGLQVGQGVVAIGSPLGLAGTVTTGIVSALNRPVSTSGESGSEGTVISAIQTDAPINPGNSGGALVDMDGKLIGINTAIATLGASDVTGQQSGSIGLGFAIPVDQARRVADQLTKTGHATYAQIGISVARQDPANGARVLDVTADGPAAKAGIPKGAIVTRVNDQIIDSGDALVAAVRSHQPGDSVNVTYTDDRGQNPKTVAVTLGAAAADGGR